MPINRIEALKAMLSQDPGNSFARYGLAMECINSGELEEAVRQFSELLVRDPKYAAAYFHAGQTLEKLGRIDQARDTYRRGIEVTSESGDDHARSELEGVLAMLG